MAHKAKATRMATMLLEVKKIALMELLIIVWMLKVIILLRLCYNDCVIAERAYI